MKTKVIIADSHPHEGVFPPKIVAANSGYPPMDVTDPERRRVRDELAAEATANGYDVVG